MRRRRQRLRDQAEAMGADAIGLSVGLHRGIDIAAVLQHDAKIEHGFGMVGFYFDRLAVGRSRAGIITQILPHETEIEPDRGGRVAGCGTFEPVSYTHLTLPTIYSV